VSGLLRFGVVVVAGAAVGLLGVLVGAWWIPFPIGILAGVVLHRARWAIPAGCLAGLAAWTVPLAVAQQQYGLGSTATSLAAIMGFTGAATIPVVLTCAVGLLLGLTGAWLGSAARSLLPGPLRPVQKLGDQRLEVVNPVLPKR
jgi:hypothetical protein